MVKIRYTVGDLKLRVTYSRPQDFIADYDGQFTRGGLLVRVNNVTAAPGSTAKLELVSPFGAVTIAATVFQVLTGAGVAVGFDVGAIPALASMVDAARAAGYVDDGADPLHEVQLEGGANLPKPDVIPAKTSPSSPATPPRSRAAVAAAATQDVRSRIRDASAAEQVQLALHGGKDERNVIIRGPNRRLHQYVVRNPHIQLEEVAAIARMPTVAVDILKFIAERREWAQRPEVAVALVRNPKTPVPLAVRSVEHCSPMDLRQLAKVSGVRGPIQRAIRKKVLR